MHRQLWPWAPSFLHSFIKCQLIYICLLDDLVSEFPEPLYLQVAIRAQLGKANHHVEAGVPETPWEEPPLSPHGFFQSQSWKEHKASLVLNIIRQLFVNSRSRRLGPGGQTLLC